jgi:hypothetical protein
VDVDNLDRWVETHQPDPSLEYGHGWWNGIEFIRMLRDRHRLEAVDVPATYWMETPPHPRERLLMPVYRIRHGRLECYLKTDFSLGYWYLSVRTPKPLRHTYGLFDPAMDWRREPRWLSGFREEWRYPSVTESPLRFTCELECEFDVYMLIRLLIAMPGSRWTYEASLPH